MATPMGVPDQSLSWKLAGNWLIKCGVIPRSHPIRKMLPDVSLKDFKMSLRNGVFLCRLLLKMKPGCLSDSDWDPQPGTDVLCWKNISTFLMACRREFNFTFTDLFSIKDLYDGQFQKVILCLSKLSTIKEATDLGWKTLIIPTIRTSPTRKAYNSPNSAFTGFSQSIVGAGTEFIFSEPTVPERRIRRRPQSLPMPPPKSIHEYPWYVGRMSQLEAGQILYLMPEGVFLVRESVDQPGEYIIAIKYCSQIHHITINRNSDTKGFYISDKQQFSSLEALVNYHQRNFLGVSVNSLPIVTNLEIPIYILTADYRSFNSGSKHLAECCRSFIGRNLNELTIKESDRVTILDKDTKLSGWWYGECNGKTGLFPSHCVHEFAPVISADEKWRHLMAFEAALEKRGSLEQTIVHCLFFGHPRGGKSSLIKRLTGHPPNPNIPSTGVAEKVIQVQVRKLTTSAVIAKLSVWNVLTLDDEAIALMATASQNSTAPTQLIPLESSNTTETKPSTNDGVIHIAPAVNEASVHCPTIYDTSLASAGTAIPKLEASVELPKDYVTPMEVFKQAIEQRGLEGVEQYLQCSLTLYLTDTGGQMEFQELLPALVAGPTVFFVVFRLDQDLNKTFTIEYLHPDGQSTEPYQSSFTVKETLLQSLASIASMGTYVYSKKLRKQVPLKPKVVLVGTHMDKVSPKKIAQIDRDLQLIIKTTSLYHDGLIEFASESQLVVTVNNLSPDDCDFQAIRDVVDRITKRGDFTTPSPSTWVIFSLIVRQLKSRVIAYDDCFTIAQKCGIENYDELNHALEFLSSKMGLVRHFRGEGLEELEGIVIVDPQILFDKITKLIVETFTFRKVAANVHKEFKSKGIFPLNLLKRIGSSDDADKLLTVSRLVKLLEHLHIIARLHLDTDEVKYFMPCTLAHAGSTAPVLARPKSQFDRFKKLFFYSEKQILAPLLLVTFECGYCPKGLFSALAVYLLANKMQSCLVWELQTDCIYKNSISLSVGPYDTMTLTLTPTYLEVSVVRADVQHDKMFPIEKTYTEVQQCINTAVREVTSSLNYTADAEHTLAFYCPGNHEGVEELHPAEIQFHDSNPCSVRCRMTGKKETHSLPRGYQYWFAKDSSTGKPFDLHYYYDLRQKPDSNTVDIDDTVLDSDRFVEITDYIQGLEKTDLYNLGVVLGLSYHRITDLRERYSRLEFCDGIVTYWLQKVDDVEAMNMVPSWRNLVQALKHPRVGQTGLADRIARERPVPVLLDTAL